MTRDVTHGYSSYAKGCRCQVCTDAKADYMRRRRNKCRRRRDLVNTTGSGGRNYVDGITHGYSGYQNHVCRCDECRAGRAEWDREYHDRRRGHRAVSP